MSIDPPEIPTRRHQLDEAIALLVQQQRVVVAWLDLDNILATNDIGGYRAGDALISATDHRLRELVPADALVGRYAGDEWLVVFRSPRTADVLGTLGRILVAIAQPVPLESGPVTTTASIGATSSRPGEALPTLLDRADHLMLAAKRAGKNRIAHDLDTQVDATADEF